MQLTHTPPPRYFPRISIDILLSATSWSYMQDVAWPLQLHISQWKPLPAVPGLQGIWLYMGQHFSHLSPHVWRSHWHSWCWKITRNALIRCRETFMFLDYVSPPSRTANARDLLLLIEQCKETFTGRVIHNFFVIFPQKRVLSHVVINKDIFFIYLIRWLRIYLIRFISPICHILTTYDL